MTGNTVDLICTGLAVIPRPRRFEQLTEGEWVRTCAIMTGRLVKMLERGGDAVSEDAEVAAWTLEVFATIGRKAVAFQGGRKR